MNRPLHQNIALLCLFGTFIASLTLARPAYAEMGDDVDNAMRRAEGYQDMPLKNRHQKDMQKEAEKTFRNYRKRSKEIEAWQKRIHSDGRRIVVDANPGAGRPQGAASKYLAEDERIYIFVSSSVPLATLVNYADSLDKLREPHTAMVLRGCVDSCSKRKPTLRLIKSVINPTESVKRAVEFQIDPFLFKHYGIIQVPAIVFTKGLSAVNDELSEGLDSNLRNPGESYVVYGDVGLDYALEKMNTKVNNEHLRDVIKQLRRGYYAN